MEGQKELIEVVRELHAEVRKLREAHANRSKPWYAKSPGKELLAHSATLCLAVTIGLMIHFCTGAPVTIEAMEDNPHTLPIPPTPPTTEATVEVVQAEGPLPASSAAPSASVASSPPIRAAKKRRPILTAGTASGAPGMEVATTLAFVPAPPSATPSVSVPAASAP